MAPSRASTTWGVSSSLALILILTIASTTEISALLHPSKSSSSSSTSANASASDSKDHGKKEGEGNSFCRDESSQFPNMMKYHFSSIGSTQDEARRIVTEGETITTLEEDSINMVCVTATEQSNGRGTSGRAWMGARGNTFVTIAIPQQRWMEHKHLPLTLLPLQVGILVAERVQAILDSAGCLSSQQSSLRPNVTLKWPNDVLVDEEKIAGILIESSTNNWFLIGIGVNLAYAPPVPTDGPNHGRTSTSISNHCSRPSDATFNEPGTWDDLAYQVGVDLAQNLDGFLDNPPMLPNAIVKEWKEWADFNMELVMRDTPKRERVKVVDMLPDGRIQVVGVEDGVSRVLVADYFI